MASFWVSSPDGLLSPHRWRAWWAGRKDGSVPFPKLEDEEYAPFEMRVKQKIDTAVKDLATEWQKLDGPLFEKYCRLKKDIQIDRTDAAGIVAGLEAATKGKDSAENDLSRHLKQIRLGKKTYYVLMTLLAVGEFPLNSQVFAILGERTELTYLFAATLALLLPFSAHLLGLFVKRNPFKEGGSISERVMTTGMIVAPLAAIGGVAYMREKFLQSSGVTKTLGFDMNSTTVTWIFITFNLLLFMVGTAASYFAHDPEFVADWNSWGDKVKDVRELARRLAEVQEKLGENERELAELSAKRQQLFDQYDYRARNIKDCMQIVIEVYREANLRARAKAGEPPGVRPKSFKTYPPQNTNSRMPAQLTWNCDFRDVAAGAGPAESAAPEG